MARKKRRKPAGRALKGDLAAATPGEAKAPESKDEPDQSAQRRLAKWQARVARAVQVRKDHDTEFEVELCEKYFLGQQDMSQAGRVKLNHFAATVKTMRPSLFLQSPKFYVRPKPGKPTKPVGGHVASVAEGVLDSIARQDEHLEQAAALAVLQSFWRIGVLKIAYNPRLEPNPRAGQPLYQMNEDGEPIRDPQTGDKVPLKHGLTGEPLVEQDTVLTDELYRWEWVDAANMLLPDEGPDPDKWSWLGEEVIVTLDEAKDDSRFPADVRATLRSNHSRRRTATESQRQAHGEHDDEFFKYVEVYDLREKRQLIWAEGQDTPQFLVDEMIPDWMDNDPYSVLALGEPILGPDPSPWPVPVVRDWMPVQDEYNIRRRQIMEGAKRSGRKGMYTDGAFADEDEALKLMQSPDDMTFAKVTDMNQVKILEAPDLNPGIYKDIPLLLNDWRIITGQTGARMASPDADSATEATFIERAANLRDATGQRLVLRWLGTAGTKMLQCLKATLTLDMWIALREMNDKEFTLYLERVYQIPVAQQALMTKLFPGVKEAFRERYGNEKWVCVTREQLQFEADVSVAPGSTRPKNLEAERSQFLQFLRVLGQAPQLALSRELMAYIARMFEIEDDRLLDELNALAMQMVQIQSKVAGREQGGDSGMATGGAQAAPILAALMAGAGNGGA